MFQKAHDVSAAAVGLDPPRAALLESRQERPIGSVAVTETEQGHTLEALVASELERARRAAKLSQRELAERAGIDQAMVSRLEAGARLPRLETLLALAEATGHVLELRLKRRRGSSGPTLRSR